MCAHVADSYVMRSCGLVFSDRYFEIYCGLVSFNSCWIMARMTDGLNWYAEKISNPCIFHALAFSVQY